VVEGAGLENRYALLRIVGSNPTLSAKAPPSRRRPRGGAFESRSLNCDIRIIWSRFRAPLYFSDPPRLSLRTKEHSTMVYRLLSSVNLITPWPESSSKAVIRGSFPTNLRWQTS
jgi:hypothetical protein